MEAMAVTVMDIVAVSTAVAKFAEGAGDDKGWSVAPAL